MAEHYVNAAGDNGFFIIRCSATPGCISFTWKENNSCLHCRVNRNGDLFSCSYRGKSITAENLNDLVSQLKQHGMKLLLPVNHSPFAAIMNNAENGSKYKKSEYLDTSTYIQ